MVEEVFQHKALMAERRHMTIMMVDMVGSTRRSLDSDPENFFELIVEYQRRVKDVVKKHSGFVSRFVGDGVLVYFGWPHAREDDAARAVSAGLEVVEEIQKVTDYRGQPLSCRVGIASGLMVVGRIGLEGENVQDEVFGDVPNMIDQIQKASVPNAVAVSTSTKNLVADDFELTPIDDFQLVGYETSEKVYSVKPKLNLIGQSEGAVSWPTKPTFGRSEEFSQIESLWQSIDTESVGSNRASAGQIVWLSGDSGIGKTHLAQQVISTLQPNAKILLPFVCSRAHQQTPYHPFAKSIEAWAQIEVGDDIETRLSKVAASAEIEPDSPIMRDLAPLFGGSLDTPNPLIRDDEAEQLRIFEAVFQLLARFCNYEKSIAFMEDIHWADTVSLDLLRYICERLDGVPLLAIITYRDEIDPPDLAFKNQTWINLQPLEKKFSSEFISSLCGEQVLKEKVTKMILERTEGVPLYLDAYTRTMLDIDSEKQSNSGMSNIMDVPGSLNDLLMEQLDRLGPAKSVAQTCAAINQDFPFELLASLVDLEEADLRATLDHLVQSNILVERLAGTQTRYAFRHMLIQDAAYQGLLLRSRKQLHLEIAKSLEQNFAQMAGEYPAFVAEHYRVAERFEDAIGWLVKAARKSMVASSNREAIGQIDQALVLNRRGTDNQLKSKTELSLNLLKAKASRACFGFADKITKDALSRVMELASGPDNSEYYAKAVAGMFTAINSEGQYDEAITLAEKLLQGAPENSIAQANALSMKAIPLLWKGEFDPAVSLLNQAAQIHAGIAFEECEGEVAIDAIWSNQEKLPPQLKANMAIGLAFVGQAEFSNLFGFAALNHAKQNGDNLEIAHCYISLCNSLRILRDNDFSVLAAEFTDFVQDKELPYYSAAVDAFMGISLCEAGDIVQGMDRLQSGWEAFTLTKSRLNQVFYMVELAKCRLLSGDFQMAIEAIETGLSFCETFGERNFEAELYRVKAQIVARDNRSERANIEALFQRAINIANTQGGTTFELRAINDLAEFLIGNDQHDDANSLLNGAKSQGAGKHSGLENTRMLRLIKATGNEGNQV